MRRCAIISLPLLCAFLCHQSVHALELSGNLRLSYYGFETFDGAGTLVNQNLFYPYVFLRGSDTGIDGLGFAANFRFRGDASGNLESDRNSRVYSLYTDVRDRLPLGVSLRFGRQFLYEGVGTGHLDGLKMDVGPVSWLRIAGWAGTQVRWSAPAEAAPWNESRMYGGRVVALPTEKTQASVGFTRRNRDRELERKLLGFDLTSSELRWIDIYFKLDWDLELDELRNTTVRGRPMLEGPFQIDLEYARRAPTVRAGSIFGIINYRGYDEVRVLPTYALAGGVLLTGEYGYVRYESDNTHRLRGGMAYRGTAAGLDYRTGYAGGRVGVYGSVHGELLENLDGLFQLDYAKYSLIEGASLDDESLVAVLRLTRFLPGGFRSEVEAQIGRNPVFDTDFRMFARLDYRFGIRK